MVIIIVNVRKTIESEVSVLLRILTNYIQIITTTISFSTNYPDSVSSFLAPAKSARKSSEAFMSFDCFATDYEIKGPFPSTSFLKLFLIMWLPIIIFLLTCIFWIIVYIFKRSWVKGLKRTLAISFISIVFLLHPRLAQEGFSIFRCVEIDSGNLKVRVDTDIACYSFEHIKWCILLGIPILLVWVTSLPLIALILMHRSVRKENSEGELKQNFLILYQGLKTKHFYWEFVNSLKKVIILISFLFPEPFKIGVPILTLLVAWRVQNYLRPYKYSHNNEIDMLGVNVAIVTLLCGMIYNQVNTLNSLNSVLLMIMTILNTIFIVQWIYLFVANLGEKYSICEQVGISLLQYLGCKGHEICPNEK